MNPIRNLPSESIKAFSFRIEQFKNLVESNASKFFIGLQPTIWSKQEISTQEKEYVEDSIENTSQGRFKTLNKKMAYLYERLDQNSMLTDIGELINLHDYFKHFTENDTLFRDYVHCTASGDKKIADKYFEEISKYFNNSNS